MILIKYTVFTLNRCSLWATIRTPLAVLVLAAMAPAPLAPAWLLGGERSADLGPNLRVEFVDLAGQAQPLTSKALVDEVERLRLRNGL